MKRPADPGRDHEAPGREVWWVQDVLSLLIYFLCAAAILG
jgi:hypothetical protein